MSGKRHPSGIRSEKRNAGAPVKRNPAVMGKLREALGFHASGQVAMADHLYREVLQLDSSQADALHWLGVLEGQAGNLERAVELLDRSVQSNAKDPIAWDDLGTAYRALNQRPDALAAFERAIALKPDFAKAHCDRAGVLRELGRLDEARQSVDRARGLAADDVEACLLSAQVRADMDDVESALDICKRACELEDSHRTQSVFAEVLRQARFQRYAADLVPYVVRAIAAPWGRPNDISAAAASLLMQDDAIRTCAERASALGQDTISFETLFAGDEKVADAVCGHPLLLALLSCGLIEDLRLQQLLIALRRSFLLHSQAGRHAFTDVQRTCISALARQFFINEYVFDATPLEQSVLDRMRGDTERLLTNAGGNPDEVSIMLLAAYQPIVSIRGAQALLDMPCAEELAVIISQQMREPAVEVALAAEIRVLTPVEDAVSRAVQAQYESHPYPRWVGYPRNTMPSTVDHYLGSRFPQARFRPLGRSNAELDILVAGCGTGQHAIEVASFFRGARILAIDLSRASLAYAKRKARELDVDRLDFAQADILKLQDVERRFDVIESIGVLHHLDEPGKGWRVLQECLKPGGVMRIGLYSELARKPVVAVREFIAQRGYPPTIEGIRACRKALLDGEGPQGIEAVIASPDFQSTSAIRDLLFHVKEHRYTLARLQHELRELGLSFIGFELASAIQQRYRQRFPQDVSLTDLECWNLFEQENPAVFGAMYVFWVQQR
jgi:SAM-dependent methyltransferase/tetratricopeptide (TPR) repeat protein